MNARLINKYKELLAQFSDCHRRVLPVVNTCLDNITLASEFVDADKVCDKNHCIHILSLNNCSAKLVVNHNLMHASNCCN